MKKCQQCDIQLTRNNVKFCSRKCSCIYRNNHNHPRKGKGKGKPICATALCDNRVDSYSHKFCRQCIESKQMMVYTKNPTKGDLACQYTKHNHRSSAYSYIRWHARAVVMKDVEKKSCIHCGYDKHVELCHIKSIQNFSDNSTLEQINNPENLMFLCPNCHWEFDNGLLKMVHPARLERAYSSYSVNDRLEGG
jgi:hypothetical protein